MSSTTGAPVSHKKLRHQRRQALKNATDSDEADSQTTGSAGRKSTTSPRRDRGSPAEPTALDSGALQSTGDLEHQTTQDTDQTNDSGQSLVRVIQVNLPHTTLRIPKPDSMRPQRLKLTRLRATSPETITLSYRFDTSTFIDVLKEIGVVDPAQLAMFNTVCVRELSNALGEGIHDFSTVVDTVNLVLDNLYHQFVTKVSELEDEVRTVKEARDKSENKVQILNSALDNWKRKSARQRNDNTGLRRQLLITQSKLEAAEQQIRTFESSQGRNDQHSGGSPAALVRELAKKTRDVEYLQLLLNSRAEQGRLRTEPQ